jgi:DNA mismatch repair ATPase MutS
MNESFAATNEREGTEIGRQIISALVDNRIRVVCVTHMYELAHHFLERDQSAFLFLRAAREENGARSFKVEPGEPLPTSFGGDLYRALFDDSLDPSPGSKVSP